MANQRNTQQSRASRDDKVIGENLKGARERERISQGDLASAMVKRGFSVWRQTTVSRTERGERRLSLEEAGALGHLFGPDLFAGTDMVWTPTTVLQGRDRSAEKRVAAAGPAPASLEARIRRAEKALQDAAEALGELRALIGLEGKEG